ncbi:MAG: hypothetical protein ACPGED_11295, partial [Flavobacteriales bacterium]
NENQLLPFSEGMVLNYKGKQFQTGPTVAHAVGEPEWLVDREPPIRMRKNKPTSWLELVLTEGKNRQVRKMTAHVGLPTLRLIRSSIESFDIKDYSQGTVTEIDRTTFYQKANLSIL